VLIRPVQQGLMLHGLFYADEVRSLGEIELGDEVALKEPELALACQLIEQLAAPRFDPARYEDDYRRALLEAVERKVAGQEIVAAPAEETRETIIDLVAALKRSLEGKRGAPAAAPTRERKPAKAKGRPAAARKKSNSRP
jgi:DNA end-binding protein Ku